jgi:hypothetical protein
MAMPLGATAREATREPAISASLELPSKDRYHEEAQEE